VRRPNTKVRPKSKWSIETPYLTNDKSPVSEGEEHRVKNDDEIDESHESQLKFERGLLNYTIKIFKKTQTGLLRFLRNL